MNKIQIKDIKKLENIIKKESIKLDNMSDRELKKIIKNSRLHEVLDDIFKNLDEEFIESTVFENVNFDIRRIIELYLDMKNIIIFDENDIRKLEKNYEFNLGENSKIDYESNLGKFDNLSDNHVRDYILSLKTCPVLSYDESDELFRRYNNGEKDLRDKLIKSNLRLVISVLRQYIKNVSVDMFMDLVNEGNIGLMTAIDKYDVNKGYRFSTYATWWIRQAITRAMSEKSRCIHLPTHLIEESTKIRKTIRNLTFELGREPTKEEICKYLDITMERLNFVLQKTEEPVSLETNISDEGNEVSELIEYICDKNTNVENEALQKQLKEIVTIILDNSFTERERGILQLRFGLIDDKERTLEEIGKLYHMSRERVRQIEAGALKKLSYPKYANKLKDFYR